MATTVLGSAIRRGLAASRPASGDANKAGQLYYATDEDKLYQDDGATWAVVATNVDAATLQPLDGDLTAIAALTPSNDDLLQRKAGAWQNRTLAQLTADLAALAAWTEAVQDVIGAMVAAAGGTYDDAAGTITLPGGGGGAALTVEEADGTPTDSAVTKIVFPNGTLGIAGHVATYTPTTGQAELGYVESTDTTDRTNASGTLTDVNALALTIAAPAAPLIFTLQIGCYTSASASRHEFVLYDVTAGAVVGTAVVSPQVSSDSQFVAQFRVTPPSSGTRSYKVQTRSVDGATLHYRAFPVSGGAGIVPYSLRAIG